MARVRNVPLVFLKRKCNERDKFRYRKFVSGKKNSFSRGTFADCKNFVGTCRAHFFYNRAVFNVRGLRLLNFDLQSANNLLSLRNDLFIARNFLAYEFFDGFFARCRTIYCDDFAIWLLGHAHFLEFEHDTRAVSIFFAIKSRVLSD